jgi:hypothetical protein
LRLDIDQQQRGLPDRALAGAEHETKRDLDGGGAHGANVARE